MGAQNTRLDISEGPIDKSSACSGEVTVPCPFSRNDIPLKILKYPAMPLSFLVQQP